MEGDAYTQTPFTKFNRHKERGTYDAETVHNIINTSSVLHVSFTTPDSPFPVTLPMIGQVAQYDGDTAPHVYLHGYVSSRMMNVCAAATPPSSSTTTSSSSPAPPRGLPLTITATKVDGLVLALTPFSHSLNYRSAMLHGHATILDDAPAEKLWAMRLITDGVLPTRWAHSRSPPDAAELAATRIIKVAIAAAAAKVRAQTAGDERKDMGDAQSRARVWVGVVPAWEAFGEPVPAPYNRVDDVPEHVAAFVRNENENAREYAVWAAGREAGKKKKKEEGEEEDEE